MTLTVTDLFAGAGGSSEGLHQAGFRITLAADHSELAIATHRLNHPSTEHRIANLAETDMRTLPRTDLLWASPSCVWHSPSGGRKALPLGAEMLRQGEGSIDRATAFAVIAAVEVNTHPVVIVENVPELRGWVLYRWWLEGLRALGYRVRETVIDSATLGAPQRRKRLYVVSDRPQDGIDVDLTPPLRAAASAASICDDDPGRPRKARLYKGVEAQLADRRPDERHLRHIVTWRRNARIMRADAGPLSTVTAGGRHHGVVQDIDGVTHLRMLTTRELARAQGFPDTYRFCGDRSEDVVRQIGNAVPVGVARWLGERARAAIVAAEALGVAS